MAGVSTNSPRSTYDDMAWQEILRANWVQLQEKLNTESGLKGELLQREVFIERIINDVWDMKDIVERRTELLNHLLQSGDEDKFKLFKESLLATDQRSVVNELLSVSHRDAPVPVPAPTFPCTRPLERWQSENIRTNYNKLLDNIRCDAKLLGHLHAVFPPIFLHELQCTQQSSKRTGKILEYMRRASTEQYDQLCQALRENYQEFVVTDWLSPPRAASGSCAASMYAPRVSSSAASKLPMQASGEQPRPTPVSMSQFMLGRPTGDLLRKVQQSNDVYRDDHRRSSRGHALIISNETFTQPSCLNGQQLSRRDGTALDVKNLIDIFGALKFAVTVHENQTAEGIRMTCRDHSKIPDLSQSCIFVTCVLSHGTNGKVYGTDGELVSNDELMAFFDGQNCQHLKGKPKLFFIQACQGDKVTKGVDRSDAAVDDEDLDQILSRCSLSPGWSSLGDATDAQRNVRDHEKLDIALVLASPADYAAWRNVDKGSYFVHCLTTVLAERCHLDHLDEMLRGVRRKMNDLVIADGKKQICEMRSTLTKEVYLLPY